MESFALFPHGNIICEISLLRKELIKSFFESKIDYELKKIFKITPLFSTFAILDFCKDFNIENQNEISKLFVNSKIKPTISDLQFDEKYFFLKISHPILCESQKTDLEFLPYTNRFNLAKIDLINTDVKNNFFENENLKSFAKLINWQEKSLRVFQIAKILQESIFENKILLELQTENKKWVKIN